MLFINLALAAGVAGIAIPIVLHLLNRRTARVVEWGAMRFLLESITSRRRRVQLEEALLMAARCLLVALLALALARPFVPPESSVPWMIVLPILLAAVAALGVAVALWQSRRWRLLFGAGALLFLALAAGAIAFERRLNLDRFTGGERQDVALIIDASTSMSLAPTGGDDSSTDAVNPAGMGRVDNFRRAIDEARRIVEEAGGGDAFSVILAGPVPAADPVSPVSGRNEIGEALDAAIPTGGGMAAYDALAYAGVVLSQGYHSNKQIVILTDGQRHGWEIDKAARWEALREGFATLPSPPQIIVRQLPVPGSIRNVAVARVELSRRVVGTDRPVRIEVTIENSGTEAVTPGPLEFLVDGEAVHRSALGQFLPGEKSVVGFDHTFRKPGAVLLEAVLDARDDLPADDRHPLAFHVQGELRVLLVDGSSTGASFFDQATAFAALALAPGYLETRAPVPDDSAEDAGAEEGGNGRGEPRRFLVAPETMSAAEFASLPTLAGWHVIILADVPRLPPAAARQTARFVAAGGGLLVAPGQRAEPDFYNRWAAGEGGPVLPLSLVRFETIEDENQEAQSGRLQLSSFAHPALRILADPATSDLGTTVLRGRWSLEEPSIADGDVSVAARLRDGGAFLVERRLGAGSVLLSAAALDHRQGNLATRQAFVPLVHELVYHLANPGGVGLAVQPAAEILLELSATGGGGRAAAGLLGRYYSDRSFRDPVLTRVDPAVDFRWGPDAPGPHVGTDGFSVRWTGTLRPRFSEVHEFSCEADDDFSLWIDDRPVIRGRSGGSIALEAGRSHVVRAEFVEFRGEATARLYWRSDSEPWGIVPTSVLSPVTAQERGGDRVDRFPVLGPGGRTGEAEIVFTREGLTARIGGGGVPGAWRLEIPPEKRESYRFLLGEDGTNVPFSVASDPAESRFDRLTSTDLDFIGSYVDVLQPESPEEVTRILEGREFGRELWRMLAIGALTLLLAEILLSRWIARSRAVGEQGGVMFEAANQPREEFLRALESMRDRPGSLPPHAGTGPRG